MDQRQHDLEEDEDDDDDFHEVGAVGVGLVGEDLVDALGNFQLALDAALPVVQVEACLHQAVDARQVLVAHQLQHIPGAFEQLVSLDLQTAEHAQRPVAEGQAVTFSAMQPTPVRTPAPGHANLDLVHDVPLEISAVLGQTELSLREVVSMQTGSVFELDKLSTEPIDLYVNNILIARGEVVVVDDKFAVKISELNPVVDRI